MLGSAPIGAIPLAKTTLTVAASTSSHSYTGSGTLQFNGTAVHSKVKVYTPSGKLTFSGAATTTHGQSPIHTYVGSGKIKFSGSATTLLKPIPNNYQPVGWHKATPSATLWVPSIN